MPMYDFKCTKCEHEFEKIVLKYDTEQRVPCPVCGEDSKTFMPMGSRKGVKFLFNYMAPDAE